MHNTRPRRSPSPGPLSTATASSDCHGQNRIYYVAIRCDSDRFMRRIRNLPVAPYLATTFPCTRHFLLNLQILQLYKIHPGDADCSSQISLEKRIDIRGSRSRSSQLFGLRFRLHLGISVFVSPYGIHPTNILALCL